MANEALKLAWAILRSFDPRKKQLDDEIARRRSDMPKNLVGVVNALCDSALRYGRLFDHMIAHLSKVPPQRMERHVIMAFHVGLADWIRGGETASIVKATVGLLKPNHRAKPLLNAVMRRVTENFRAEALNEGEEAVYGPRSIPVLDRRVIRCDLDYFPAETRDAMQLAAGIPDWLMTALGKTLIDEELDQVLRAATTPPMTWFRFKRDELEARKEYESIEGARVEACALGLPPREAHQVIHSKVFKQGRCTVQDWSAQQPVLHSPIEEGWQALDMCAAPGGKTCQIAEAVGKDGQVTAFDVNDHKLKKIKNTIDRMGHGNVSGAFGDGSRVELPAMGEYDYALLDAPCSNTGVMARRVEVRSRLEASDVEELYLIQLALIRNTARHLKPGGTLMYSTCSLLDEENGKLVRDFLDDEGGEKSGWLMMDEQLTLPEPGVHDGGYFCRLVKPRE